MRKLRVLLGAMTYLNDGNRHNWYVPLNLGYIDSYAKNRFGPEVEFSLSKCPREFLQRCGDERPDLVGLSWYYCQVGLNDLVLRKIDPSIPVVGGGPCIDTDSVEREGFRRKHRLTYTVTNEGEVGFAKIIGGMLAGDPGEPTDYGTSTDLSELPSPYLDGTLDAFLGGEFQPMIQTSRLCPYTCAFCVSGKTRGKLRAFPMEQVREELEFIGSRFKGDTLLYVVDENFGILERDKDVAREMALTKERHGYPNRIFYYNDKRFTQISRDVHEIVGDMCHHGVCLSLQSDNPETLKAVKRRNITDEQIVSALAWAKGRGLKTSTELIFGMPYETLDSFMALLDKCVRLGFQVVQCYALILFDGIEMNRPAYRTEHQIRTARRPINAHTIDIDGDSAAEYEEVVTSTKSFSQADYAVIRKFNVLFHAVFVYGMCRDGVARVAASGASVTRLLRRFLDHKGDPDHAAFMADLDEVVRREIACEPQTVVKIQPVFAGRLLESTWANDILGRLIEEELVHGERTEAA